MLRRNKPESKVHKRSISQPETYLESNRLSIHRHSADHESLSPKRNSTGSNYRNSIFLHLRSVLHRVDNGLCTPPESPLSSARQPVYLRSGKPKHLPPLPIIDNSDPSSPEQPRPHGLRSVYGRLFSKNTDLIYPLPIDEEEIDRMQVEHYLLKELFGDALYHSPVTDQLAKGAHVLDLGQVSILIVFILKMWMWSLVHGCDIAPMYPTSVIPENCAFELCDVSHGLPFSDGSFDLVVSRNMALALRYDIWEDYVDDMVRVARPGAFIEIIETDWDVKSKGPRLKTWNATSM
ncbi:hypothetical protein Unana1_05009 [Umbelopsis nana]